jgi:hypothetical protein
MSLPSTRISVCRNVNTLRVQNMSSMARVTQPPVIFVEKSSQRRSNFLLGPNKNFPFHGDVAIANSFGAQQLGIETNEVEVTIKPEPQTSLPFKTLSIEQLLNLSSNVKKAADYEPTPFVDKLRSDCNIELKAVECPRLLKKELKYLFVDMDLNDKNITVLNLTQKTDSDMCAWSPDMEVERMKLTASFIDSATAICKALKEFDYWADFIDPSSGRPYLGKFTNACLFETDDRYRQLGFQIEDLGCCKVVKHMTWGTHAFVGTIFTDAPLDCEFIKSIMKNINDAH